MIQSTHSKSDPLLVAINTASLSHGAKALVVVHDRLSTDQSKALSAALARTPEIRAEVVERGRALANDPSYPPMEIINRLSDLIVRSDDLTEIE